MISQQATGRKQIPAGPPSTGLLSIQKVSEMDT
jgi:hypothetical protein